jgi:hypothetical protein
MDQQSDIPPMRPVRADDVIPEKHQWESPKRMLPKLAIMVGVGVAYILAESVFHVSWPILFATVVALGVVAIAIRLVRWRRYLRH